MPETLKGVVQFADPESPEEWAAATEMLYRSPHLRELLARRVHACAQCYTWEAAATQYLELFRSAAG
jgi:hypothetical protein